MKRNAFLASLAVLFAGFMTGCATAPSDAPAFSEELLGKPDEKSAIVVVYRVASAPFSYDARTFVNGRKVVNLPNESFTWVRVPAGNTSVEMKWPLLAQAAPGTAVFQAEAGRTYFVRASYVMTGDFVLGTMFGTRDLHSAAYEESYNEAMNDLRECCRYVPAETQDVALGAR